MHSEWRHFLHWTEFIIVLFRLLKLQLYANVIILKRMLTFQNCLHDIKIINQKNLTVAF